MATLMPEQLQFLVQHDIGLAHVFDATGYNRTEYMEIMSSLGLLVAYGVPRCTFGHTLKTRKGHCPQCRPENLAYLRRHNKPGSVYVARSAASGLVKIGSGERAADRVGQLRQLAYGGGLDWSLEFELHCCRAGRAEFDAHRQLEEHRAAGHLYVKNGIVRECRELFTCGLALATKAVQQAVAIVEASC